MDKILNTVQSFIHSVTTNDRYASYESQYDPNRSSNGHGGGGEINSDSGHYPYSGYGGDQHPTIKDGFTAVGMNSIANASSSSLDRLNTSVNNNSTTNNNNNNNNIIKNNSNYSNNSANTSSTSLNRIPYTPGLRSQQLGNGHIPLQDYAEGGTPLPPSPMVSWSRIDRWVEANYPELYDQLSYPVTSADLNELEADLDCSLPLEVRDSYLIHDGQERGGKPTGLFFSITLLQLEGIVEEWSIWRKTAIKVNEALKRQKMQIGQLPPQPSSSKTNHPQSTTTTTTTTTGIAWLDRQESVPENAIQRVYAHPAWIPLAKDWEGNNIAIDLAPGPKGRWGQVILFGRDFDRKYVIASSWAAFLATFADDLELGNHYINDDIEEGQMMFRTPNGRIVSYFNVLRSRVDRQIRQVRKQVVRQSPASTVPSAAAQSRRPASASGSKSPSPVINSITSISANDGHSNNGTSKLSSPQPREGSDSLISPVPSTTSLPLPSTGLSTSSSLEKEREKVKQEEEVNGEAINDNLVVEQKDDDHDKENEQEAQKIQVQEAKEVSKDQSKESESIKQEPTQQPKSESTDLEEQDEVDMLNDELSDVEI